MTDASDVSSLERKLAAFVETLTAGEAEAFDDLLVTWHEDSATIDDVMGYEAPSYSAALQRINDMFAAMARAEKAKQAAGGEPASPR